eukprot:CAMPEP_0173462546 /NCGR_PEP_ID=MMETSP1357-20121228/66824_1 /TAXON_ID=77926 /ORGANISM="Hemiselmis rufescens, Strain PCC563" /LENGTH=55 /DNA_ID=CAMNT_0014430283 /DNA_START=164 /DNA_END=330 /DNA_ORIENTATION=+
MEMVTGGVHDEEDAVLLPGGEGREPDVLRVEGVVDAVDQLVGGADVAAPSRRNIR